MSSQSIVSKSGMVLLGLLFVAGYAALDACAFGSWRMLFDESARVSFFTGMTLLAVLTGASEFNFSMGDSSDLANNWIFLPLIALGILHGYVGAYCDRRGLWVFQSPAVRWIGIVIFAAGAVLRVAAMRTLGNRFSVWVALQNSHSLVTGGLYRYVRHPSYTGALLALVGSALVFRSELALAIALAMVLPLIPRMEAEEKMLIKEFGSEYIDYQERTWRIVPWIY